MTEYPDLDEMNERFRMAQTAFAEAIGTFAIAFVEMEARFDDAIHRLLQLDHDTGHALTSAIRNFSTRTEILQSLANSVDLAEDHRTGLLTSIDAAIALSAYRTWLLHDRWAGIVIASFDPIPKHQKARMRKKRGGYDWQHDEFTSDAIKAKAAECVAVSNALAPVLNQLWDAEKHGKKAK